MALGWSTSPYEMLLSLARANEPRHRYRAGTDVAQWRAAALSDVLETLGELPPPVDADPRLVAEWEVDGIISQRWELRVSQHLTTFAYVNRPIGLAEGESRPAILCWHGHTAGRGGKEAVLGNPSGRDPNGLPQKALYGVSMAQQGFVTFGMDWFGFGDQNDAIKPNHRNLAGDRDWCNLYYLQATMLGMTPLGINLTHGKRLVDFVTTLPFVQADRLGVMGLSNGGTMALWSALIDERIGATEVICYSDQFTDFGFRDYNYCGSQITPGLFRLVELADLQGLLAPRPLLVDIGAYDPCFRIESAMACHSRVRAIYDAADATDALDLNLFPGAHTWPGTASARFFSKHLLS